MSQTPMMRQYLAIKEQYPDEILFYRMGDFYEMFFEDAIAGSKILGIALTKRGKHQGDSIPMCGVPAHSYEQYLERLIRSGRKVAICEQVETPEQAKKRGYKEVVRREVTRIITGGTIVEDNLLNCSENNYLCVIFKSSNSASSLSSSMRPNENYHIAFADLGTKDIFFTHCDIVGLHSELCKISPKELLISDKLYSAYKSGSFRTGGASGNKSGANSLNLKDFENVISTRSDSIFHHSRCVRRLQEFYEISDLGVIESLNDGAIVALGVLIEYLEHTQKKDLKSLKLPKLLKSSDFVSIDASTLYNLEVIGNAKSENFSLLNAINSTCTKAGSRLMHNWLLRPLKNKEVIVKRQANIEFLLNASDFRKLMRKSLPKFPDLDRLLAKVYYRHAGPRDLKFMQNALEFLQFFCQSVAKLKGRGDLCAILNAALIDCSGFADLIELLNNSIKAEPPLSTSTGGFIRTGYCNELQSMLEFKHQINTTLSDMRNKYADISGISNLKIASNNLIGYYIEVPQQVASKMNPSIFKHRQSLSNVIRFTTTELADLQEKLMHIDEKIFALELKLFDEICDKLLEYSGSIEIAASTMAKVDVYLAAAENADNYQHIKPEIVNEPIIDIQEGRHPIIEFNGVDVVPNDLLLSDSDRIWLINGPNMAGKSTFLRQSALLVLLAQVGFFVPAANAKIGLVDKIFSRIGASDNTSRGQSTFMVEMLESSYILNNATRNSLIIFDEVGRGTATYDGLSLAWSILEYIHNTICARTLFATHYHELKQLASQLSALTMHTPQVEECGNSIAFKYKIAAGSAVGSYGIHVAELAGVPKVVVKRAKKILAQFESDPIFNSPAAISFDTTDTIIESDAINDNEKNVLDELKSIDINALTPIDAITLINKLKNYLA